MEADEVTEEPHTTTDAEEHRSSKDPSAEDSQEPPITETPLEPSVPETPLEPLTSESPLEPSSPLEPYQVPLETQISEAPLEPSISETPLEPHTYESLLEPSISKASLEHSIPESPLESHISKVPEKHFTSHKSSPGHVSVASSQVLKEDLFSGASSSQVLWTRRSNQISESEVLQKPSLSGSSAQAPLNTPAKEREENGEDREGVDATESTAHTAQPGHHLGKKKEKKGVSRNYACPFFHSHHSFTCPMRKGLGYSLTWPLLLILGPPHFPFVTQPFPSKVTQSTQWSLLSRQSWWNWLRQCTERSLVLT